MYKKRDTINALQEDDHNSATKVEKEELFKIDDIQINCSTKYIEKNIEIDCFRAFALRRRNARDFVENSNKDEKTAINRYRTAINNEKSAHNMRRSKEKSDVTIEFERERDLRQRITHSPIT